LLRITVEDSGAEVRLMLEGRLEQSLVPELERALMERHVIGAEQRLILDLRGLTGMDQAGESTLQKLYQRGAQLSCADLMNEYLVERITLGAGNPVQAPFRPCDSNVTPEIHRKIQTKEEKESANCDQF